MPSGALAVLACLTACGRSEVGLLDALRSGGGSGGDGAAGTSGRGGNGESGAVPGGRGGNGGSGVASGGVSTGGGGAGGFGAGGRGASGGTNVGGSAGEGSCEPVAPGTDRTTPFGFQFGDEMNQSGRSILAAPDGSLFVAGAFEGTLDLGGDIFQSGFGDDPVVARFDPRGRHLFSRHFSGTRVVLYDMDSTHDGNRLYCAGDFSGTADFGAGAATSEGPVSAFLVALDACGNVERTRVFGGENSRVSIASVKTIEDSVVVTGTFEGTLELGSDSLTADPNRADAFVARFDRSLDPIWVHRLGGAGHLVVTADEEKNVYVAGSLDGTIDVGTEMLTGHGRAFALKLNSRGRPAWFAVDQVEELGSSSWAESIILNEAGHVVVLVDLLYKPLDFGGSLTSAWVCCGHNVFALAIHPDGVPLRLTPIDRHVTTRIAPATGGFVAVTSDGGAHGFDVRRYDLFGAVTSSERFGATSYVDVFGVSEDVLGSLVVTGQFRGELDLGSGVLETVLEFDWDGFVARLPPETSERE